MCRTNSFLKERGSKVNQRIHPLGRKRHWRFTIQNHFGTQHTEVLRSISSADGDNHPHEDISFVSWICTAVITTKKGNTMLLGQSYPPACNGVILLNRERLKGTYVFWKSECSKHSWHCQLSYTPWFFHPLVKRVSFEACRVFCHVLAYTVSIDSRDSSSVRSSLSTSSQSCFHPSQKEIKWRGEKFTKKGTTPDKHTSDIFLCIPCSESCTQPLGIKSSLIMSKQLSRETRGCSKAQAGLHPTCSSFSLVAVVGTACTVEEEDVQERECQWKKELPELIPVSSNKLDMQKDSTISI